LIFKKVFKTFKNIFNLRLMMYKIYPSNFGININKRDIITSSIENHVKKYGFKLEGGEWFKEVFRKLLSQE